MADTVERIPEPAQEKQDRMGLWANILAIIGFIILAVVVVWGALHLLNLTKFSVGSVFTPAAKIQVTAPQSAPSGQQLTISWKNTGTAQGTYAFLYECEKNFSFGTQGQGAYLNPIPCGASISAGSSTSATMIPVLMGTTAVSVPVSIVFTPENGGTKITGSATIAIAPVVQPVQAMPTPQETAPAKTTPAPAKPAAPTTHVSHTSGNYSPVAHAASGPADLSVTIIAMGYIDPASGALLMNRPPQPGDIVGVEFDIANVGGSATGAWYFQAHLPTVNGYTYTSPTQVSLAPGAHIMNTLRFTQLAPGGIFTVIADPSSLINDANTTNNEAATTIY